MSSGPTNFESNGDNNFVSFSKHKTQKGSSRTRGLLNFAQDEIENMESESIDSVSVSIDVDDRTPLYENTVISTKNGTTYKEDENVFESQEEETQWLERMKKQLIKLADNEEDDAMISLPQFMKAFDLKQCYFAERLFRLCDSKHSGTTSIYNIIAKLGSVIKGTPEQRLKFLFDVYDQHGNGRLDFDLLLDVLRTCMVESSLKLSDDDLEQLASILIESASQDGSGEITFEEFRNEVFKHPGVLENLTLSAAQWLTPQKKKRRRLCTCSKYLKFKNLWNHIRQIWFFVLFILVNLGLGGYAAYTHRYGNGFLIAARICGMALNFDCIFILILMLRKSITFLRMTFFNRFLPFDDHILFHKIVGVVIAILALIHTGAHIGNAVLLSKKGQLKIWEILLTTKAGFGTFFGDAMVTGWALDLILIVMLICSMSCVRRSGHFEVFYWTHLLYIPFWILLIFHGPNFWKWFTAPGIIFVMEMFSRTKVIKKARYGETNILEVTLLPSDVTRLEISRPDNFAYQPGDYVFLQIPAISKHEWHPFTISSAPELSGSFELHIASKGNWTKRLNKFFKEYDPGENYGTFAYPIEAECSIGKQMRETIKRTSIGKENNSTAVKHKGLTYSLRYSKSQETWSADPIEQAKQRRIALKNKRVKLKCYIDGPFGTATREIFRTEHAVLIGSGIGVTPMASILQSILYKYKASKIQCPKCDHEWLGEFTTDIMRIKKVDFFWINREQKAFEWFVKRLGAIEVEQSKIDGNNPNDKIIEMHLHMTAAVKKTDMKGIWLQIALDLMHEKCNKDLISGLQVRTKPGRPDWNEAFREISERRKGKVKVFFCGVPQLGKTIKDACEKYGFDFAKENF